MQMTEKQAWEYLAKAWSDCRIMDSSDAYIHGSAYAVVGGLSCFGLCHGILSLGTSGDGDTPPFIDDDVRRSMNTRIYELTRTVHTTYVWPRTLEGAKERVKFCLDQAAKLEASNAND